MEAKKVIEKLGDLIKEKQNCIDGREEIEWRILFSKDIEALKGAMGIVYKTIPKVPVNSFCPSCKRHLRCPKSEHLISVRTKNRTGDNYCPSCGQAIDWSNSNEL